MSKESLSLKSTFQKILTADWRIPTEFEKCQHLAKLIFHKGSSMELSTEQFLRKYIHLNHRDPGRCTDTSPTSFTHFLDFTWSQVHKWEKLSLSLYYSVNMLNEHQSQTNIVGYIPTENRRNVWHRTETRDASDGRDRSYKKLLARVIFSSNLKKKTTFGRQGLCDDVPSFS